MSILTYPLGFIGGGKEFYNGVIENSLRITHANTGGNAYLRQTQSASGDRRTWTLSWWEKRGSNTDEEINWELGTDGTNTHWAIARLRTGGGTVFYDYDTPTDYGLKTDTVFRDPSAWYHIIAVWDTANGVAANRAIVYVNGVRETSLNTGTYPSQNADSGGAGRADARLRFGTYDATGNYFDGYLTEVHYTDNYAYDPSNFGEFKEDTDLWIPKEYDGSYGSNGFYINGYHSNDFGDDASGNNNDFTSNNLGADHQVLDSPTFGS